MVSSNFIILALGLLVSNVHAFLAQIRSPTRMVKAQSTLTQEPFKPFVAAAKDDSSLALKAQVLQLGAALDRGQAYNPTVGRCTYRLNRGTP